MRAFRVLGLVLWGCAGGLGGCRSGIRDVSLGADRLPAFYISPSGSDAADGSRASPWLSFAFALPRLGPGDTLVLLDGTYELTSSGPAHVLCGEGAENGIAGAPITLKADNERRAFLAGDGRSPPLLLSNCAYWTVEGLRVEAADNDDADVVNDNGLALNGRSSGSVVVLDGSSDHVVLRRLLAGRPNRARHSHVLRIGGLSNSVLVEECELYDFHHNAFEGWRAEGLVLRRNYAHSRDTVDAGWTTSAPLTGDAGFLLEETSGALLENNVAEGVARGFVLKGRQEEDGAEALVGPTDPGDNRLLGNIALPSAEAFVLESRCGGQASCPPSQLVRDTTLSDDVALGGTIGLWSIGARATQVTRFSAFETDQGVALEQGSDNAAALPTSFVSSSLASGFRESGFSALQQVDWRFERCGAFGLTDSAFSPEDAHVTLPALEEPQLGACRVYVPPTSPLYAAGEGGLSIGASLVNRYEDGRLGSAPLWDAVTGAFTCGSAVEGVNDDPASSCSGVHERLPVGAACRVP